MKVGIIGYEGSGKTTIFGALSGADPSLLGQQKQQIREVRVPDARIDALSAMYHPKKTIYAMIQFVDVMSGGGIGKGLDAGVLAKIREADLLAIVVRGFDNGYSAPDPKREAESMLSELLLSDMEIVERKVSRMQKEKASEQEKALFLKLQSNLESEIWLKDMGLDRSELDLLRGYQFMTLKPVIVLVNVDESEADEGHSEAVSARLGLKVPTFVLSARVESDIAQLPESDQAEFLADLGIQATARDRFIRASYAMLDLISFFTVGEDEVRAWTIKNGSTAQESAGRIHTDLAKHFIRAERMASADLLELGSEAAVRNAGKFRLEGKGYITQDGDILHIRANA
ncbi:MAG: DUF933 domain-containing protein [Bradymonadia bacterium]